MTPPPCVDLDTLHPTWRRTVDLIIAGLEARGFHPHVVEAWRAPERQAALVRSDASRRQVSEHQHTEAGQPAALAVDLVDGRYGWGPDSRPFFDALAELAEAHGATSGHRWRWRDSAHIQARSVADQASGRVDLSNLR